MKSADQEGVASAIAVLPTLVRAMRHDPGLEGFHLHITNPQGSGVIDCKVTIEGDTTADRDKIKAKFPAKDGWTCTNTGDKTATCSNP
jgi:hypothetical protein